MRVAYVVPVPLHGAVGQRVHTVAKAMVAGGSGHSVCLIAPSCSIPLDPDEPIDFVPTAAVEQLAVGIFSKVKRRIDRAGDAIEALTAMRFPPHVLLIYGGGAVYMSAIIRWARRHGVPVAADVVEWYDATHLPLGRLGPYAWDNHLMMMRTLRRVDGAIVISRFLYRHMDSLGVKNLVRVPPLVDRSGPETPPDRSTGPLRLAYCGSPGKKDRLDVVIRALELLDPQGRSVRLEIAGVEAHQLRQMYGLKKLPPGVSALGRISHAEAVQVLARAHFMPMVRKDERFANAGFPTKVVEALAVGTVPWVNLTSDLAEILTDGANAVVIPGSEVADVANSLARLMTVRRHELTALSRQALGTAEFFAVDRAAPALHEWLKGLETEAGRRTS